MSALPPQVGGSHYMDCKIRPVSFIEANNLKFLEGSVVKRMCRHDKPTGKGRQDIEKAIHELQLLLELRYGPEEIEDIKRAIEEDAAALKRSIDRAAKVYTKCPHCKEVTRAYIGSASNACEQCGMVFGLTVERFNEERMDRIGQNGNDGEHYDAPWIKYAGEGKARHPTGTTPVWIRWVTGTETGLPLMADDVDWSQVMAYRLY